MKLYDLFNIFTNSKNNTEIKDEELAYIKYYLTQEGFTKIDVKVHDLSDNSIANLATLINTLGDSSFLNETLNIIDNFFISSREQSSLIKLYSLLNYDIVKMKLEKNDVSPYIKPSEMIK